MKRCWYGQTPAEEPCVQLNDPHYHVLGHAEAQVHVAQLYRFLESKGHPRASLPAGFEIAVSESQHDFGVYFDVVCCFPDGPDEKRCWQLANLIDYEGPTTWDVEAQLALGGCIDDNVSN